MTSLAVAFFVTAVVASFVGLLLVAFGMVRKRQRFHEDWLVHLDQRMEFLCDRIERLERKS